MKSINVDKIKARGAAALFLEERVFPAMRAERQKQVDKWGDQSHYPSVDVAKVYFGGVPQVGTYGVQSGDNARVACDEAFKQGEGTWSHILIEEVAEVVEAAAVHGDGPELREELVQVMTVCAAWLQKLVADGKEGDKNSD